MSNDICSVTDLDREVCPHCCPQPQRPAAPTEPGIYPGIDEDVYHGDLASLSSSGARRLMEVSPAQWKWERDHPTTTSNDHFDLGTAVHTLVLGTGADFVDVGHATWQTKAAKEARQKHWDAGEVPLRTQDYNKVYAMAEAVFRNSTAAKWLSSGEPELSVWHRDPDTGVMLRTRADWVHWISADSALIVDLKTSPAPTPAAFRKSVRNFGYHWQQAWYQAGFADRGIRTAFVFLVVCDEPPHLPYIVELPARAVELGERRNREAIDIYARCLESGHWPDHGTGIHEIDLPAWEYREEQPQ